MPAHFAAFLVKIKCNVPRERKLCHVGIQFHNFIGILHNSSNYYYQLLGILVEKVVRLKLATDRYIYDSCDKEKDEKMQNIDNT